jgi:hypothetical protein
MFSLVKGPRASELRANYDKIKDNSEVDAIIDDVLIDITSKIKSIFGEIDAYITFLESLGSFGNIETFEKTQISDLEFSITNLIDSINAYNAGGKNSTAANVTIVNNRLEKLVGSIADIATSDKGRYWDESGGLDPTQNIEIILNNKNKELAAVKLKDPSDAPAAAAAPTPDTTTPAAVPSAATPAATTPGAVAFTIQGEINIESKQISKITSIKINDCAEITDITSQDGKIKEDKGLTDKIANCITGPASGSAATTGGRKRRTTAKKQSNKRTRRKSYRVFQSRRRRQRRRATHAKITL